MKLKKYYADPTVQLAAAQQAFDEISADDPLRTLKLNILSQLVHSIGVSLGKAPLLWVDCGLFPNIYTSSNHSPEEFLHTPPLSDVLE